MRRVQSSGAGVWVGRGVSVGVGRGGGRARAVLLSSWCGSERGRGVCVRPGQSSGAGVSLNILQYHLAILLRTVTYTVY